MTLVDKDWLLKALNLFDYRGDSHFLNGIHTAKDIIKDAETVEIIRCKDCKYAEMYISYIGEDKLWCGKEEKGLGDVTHDDFCSWAKRKDDEE